MLDYGSSGKLIAGVDEVGRGPLAGPVVACAVILDCDNPIAGLADSKKLSPAVRQKLSVTIKKNALAWALGRAEVEEIDRINILQASLLAMQRAVNSLSLIPELVLVDGNRTPALCYPCEAIIKGDQLVAAISAASIVAKVARDQEMIALDNRFQVYGFKSHKGYPTPQHLSALRQYGPTIIHRQSFAPVRDLLRNK